MRDKKFSIGDIVKRKGRANNNTYRVEETKNIGYTLKCLSTGDITRPSEYFMETMFKLVNKKKFYLDI